MLTAALAAVLLSGATAQYQQYSTRDSYIDEPKPWPANRVDDPDRIQLGRLWHSEFPIGNRTPLNQQWNGRIGAADYGAPGYMNDQIIYARVNHAAIAINPWVPFNQNGFDDFRTAQNIWLREQGWVLGVRTHVNAMYQNQANMYADAGEITPRATIEILRDPSAPSFPSRMRVDMGDVKVFKPITAAAKRPFRVIEPTPVESAETDLAHVVEETENAEG